MIRFLLPAFILSFVATYSIAQDFSNKGKDFWIAYPSHIDGKSSVMGIYITSDVNASGTITVGTSGSIAFTVTANQVTRKFIGPAATSDATNNYVLLTQYDGVKTNAAIHVVSDKPVVVYTHIIRSARSGACLALPTPVLGLEYIAPNNSSNGGANQGVTEIAGIGEIAVIATQPNTIIEVNPTAAGRGGRPANVPFQVTLPNAGDVYQYQGVQDADISGTTIRSVSSGGTAGCKPIAVFSASTWSAFDCTNASGGDNLLQQLFPTRTWGKKFITAPFINRPYDVYRIFVTDVNTKVYITNNGVTSLLTAASYNSNGRFYSIKTSNPLYIEGDKPISVVQYIVAQTCKSGCATNSTNPACLADPEMVLLNPIEQTLNDITFFSAHQNYVPPGQTQVTLHYVNVIINKSYKASVRIDGALPNGTFFDIPGTQYSYLQENVSASSAINPVHRIKADTSFSAIVYGYGSVESYGYNGGTNVKDLYQFVTLQNEYASVNFPATCQNTPFNFAITLPYQATSLTWDFNNNANLSPNTSVVNSSPVPDSSFVRDNRTLYNYKLPSYYRFSAVGTYPIKVYANNPSPDGCTGIQEINYDVEVYQPPKANWSAPSPSCLSDSVHFTDQSVGNGRQFAKWIWNFGDNTTDTVQNPVKLYKQADTFNVSLRAVTDIGCIADTIKKLIVTPVPVAKFGFAGGPCLSGNVLFSDSSTITAGKIVKWYWNFGNGNVVTTTTNAAPPQVYNTTGTFTATLQVESENGCKSNVFAKTFTLHVNPVVKFSLPATCLPSQAAVFANSTSISDGSNLAYLWNFGDGTIDSVASPSHVYTAAGPYTVKLTATSSFGCAKDSSITFNNIYAQPKAAFTSSAVELCVTDSIKFTDASTAAGSTVNEWTWLFSDGTTSTVKNPVKHFAAGGIYHAQLFIKSAAGCLSDTTDRVIQVDSLPAAAFTFSSPTCQAKDVSFTSQSQANSGTLNKWTWSFGDGTTTTSANGNTTRLYAAPGTYAVKLVVENSKGCRSDTLVKQVTVNYQPKTNFLLPEVCLHDAFAQFTDSSFVNNSQAGLSYQWNFGDALATTGNPNTSTLKDAKHKYNAIGNYVVRLVVTSASGCVDSISKNFTVNGDDPKASYTVLKPESLCGNVTVKIQNTSTIDFGTITQIVVLWNKLETPTLADTIATPAFNDIYSHKYPALQTDKIYQVMLRAFSGSSCVSESMQSVTVHATPLVNIGPVAGICQEAASRQLVMPGNGGVAGSGIWKGAGISSAGIVTPSAMVTGSNTMKYVYTSTFGCADSQSTKINVWPTPKAAFGYSAFNCINNAITFTDSSATAVGKINKWVWNSGVGADVAVTTNQPMKFTYNNATTYNVKLQVFTDSGCQSAAIIKQVTVHPLPVAGFSLPAVCLPSGAAQFNDLSTITDGTQSQFAYNWNFGDVNDATGSLIKNPVHYYSSTGPFNVKLVVTSGFGCKDSLTQKLTTVYPQPKASFTFTPNDTCAGGTFYFTDKSTSAAAIINWYWDLGGGSTLSIQNPVKKFSTAGVYSISLYVKNQQGCYSDTLKKSITVNAYPVVNAGPDLVVLESGNKTIKATATGNGLKYAWSPASYLNSAIVLNPVTTPLNDIIYRLTVTGTGGCKTTDDIAVTVLRALGVPNAFSPNNDGINDKWEIKYLDSYPGATVEVFNRYGQQVFYSEGYNQPWDGTLKGSPLPVGTYYYIINPKNGRKAYTGSVTILK